MVHRLEGVPTELAYFDQDQWVASVGNPDRNQALRWQLIPRQGPAQALTRDLDHLLGVQLTAAGSTGVAIRATRRTAIAVGTIANRDFAQVVEESGAEAGAAALDAAGKVFYMARASEGLVTLRREGPGSAGVLVATNLIGAVPSPDGTFVIGYRPNVGLVRANADGSDARVLLEDVTAAPLAITHDNAAVIYQSNRNGHQQPWRLTLATGATERLSDLFIGGRLWLSPDGRQVIFTTTGGVQICAFPGFEACRAVNVIAGPFSADAKTVFAINRQDPANIVAQPLDGSAPQPVTRFTDKQVFDFSVSPDGTRMAITRGTQISDVVLIKGLK